MLKSHEKSANPLVLSWGMLHVTEETCGVGKLERIARSFSGRGLGWIPQLPLTSGSELRGHFASTSKTHNCSV